MILTPSQMDIFIMLALASFLVIGLVLAFCERYYERKGRTFRSTGELSVCKGCGKPVHIKASLCMKCLMAHCNALDEA